MARWIPPEAWKRVEDEANARKARNAHGKEPKVGRSTWDQERASVAAEYVFARSVGFSEEQAWSEVTEVRREKGITFHVGDETIRIHAVHDRTHTHLIEKVDHACADYFLFAMVNLDKHEVDWRGWIALEDVKRASQQQGAIGMLSYWVPARDLTPMALWGQRRRAAPAQTSLFHDEPGVVQKKRRVSDDENDPFLR